MEALDLKPEKLTMYYVESGERISTTRTVKQLEDKKAEVVEVVQKIKSGAFDPNPGMQCEWCDYKNICPYVWKG